ncbi:MAG: hypothetical protein M3T96_11280 [Acidobacteriota bacterium]|nr:hypothetical protein [Acidobacteriota bacterium]
MEGKKLKKKLSKIPDVDRNGDPIFKIAGVGTVNKQSGGKSSDADKRNSK